MNVGTVILHGAHWIATHWFKIMAMVTFVLFIAALIGGSV